jgi:hypothetical protein
MEYSYRQAIKAQRNYSSVIPAQAEIHPDSDQGKLPRWIPACAGMTGE